MKYAQRLLILGLLILGVISFGGKQNASAESRAPRLLTGNHQRVCGVSVGALSCLASVMTDSAGKPVVTTLPTGYGPAQLHGAYQLPTSSIKPATIALIDAYDDPNITKDLSTYDSTYGLPVFPTCTRSITTSCFTKVNQSGTTQYPQGNSSWGLETSLDVETAHEICQNCKIILVEASTNSYTNLMKAVDEARILGATVISNSYGSSEFNGETSYDSNFNYTGIAFIFSAGDGSYGATYPAASSLVTSVGGTTLAVSSTNTWQSETVWSGTGSGCSIYETKPVFQKDAGCLHRTVADVAADANPNTGAAVYDSYGYRGWLQVGGTSLAAPIIAGVYALSNNVAPSIFANSLPYSNYQYGTNLRDVTSGTNGSCNSSYLCQATTGYDGPTGLGTPIGLGAF